MCGKDVPGSDDKCERPTRYWATEDNFVFGPADVLYPPSARCVEYVPVEMDAGNICGLFSTSSVSYFNVKIIASTIWRALGWCLLCGVPTAYSFFLCHSATASVCLYDSASV